MLTEDENIVEIKFAVQYRLNDARAYLFESEPARGRGAGGRTAVREMVGKMRMDSALAEERDQIAPRVRKLDADASWTATRSASWSSTQPAAGRASARAGAGRVRRRAQGRPGARARQERGAGLRQRRDPARQRRRLAPDAGGRRLQGAHRGAGPGRRAALQAGAGRIPAGAAGHARPHVHRRDAADLQQRDQDDGGRHARRQPAVPAARQDHAAGAASGAAAGTGARCQAPPPADARP